LKEDQDLELSLRAWGKLELGEILLWWHGRSCFTTPNLRVWNTSASLSDDLDLSNGRKAKRTVEAPEILPHSHRNFNE